MHCLRDGPQRIGVSPCDQLRAVFIKQRLHVHRKAAGDDQTCTSACSLAIESCQAFYAVIERFRDETGVRDLEQAAEHLAAHALYRIETEGIETVRFDEDEVRRLLEL